MLKISKPEINKYHQKIFRTEANLQIHDLNDAISFVNERGFIFFWPIKKILFPSLWCAVAGERPVADAHDDPGHITWGWKDSLLGKREWYYAKVLRKKSTIISFEIAPYFYALSENYGSYDVDYLTNYEQGRITLESKKIYEAILENGVMDSIALRHITNMNSRSSESRFNRTLADLQSDFKVLPVKVTQSGGWHYSFAYDIVARHYPDVAKAAQDISENTARRILIGRYLYSVGAAQIMDIVRLFQWPISQIRRALEELSLEGSIIGNIMVENNPEVYYAVSELFLLDQV